MSYYFDPSDKIFYREGIHAEIPESAIKISSELYRQMQDRAANQVVDAAEDGMPILVELVGDTTPAIASTCTPAQGLIALFALQQITEDAVLAAIGSIPDAVQRYTAQIGYQRATTWDRASPTMQALAQLLQLSEEDLDALYSYAVTVQV